MSTRSNDTGRAYEYAWIHALYHALSGTRKTEIVKNSSLQANRKAWEVMTEAMQNLLVLSAESAVDTVLELEPGIFDTPEEVLFLESRKDSTGIKGDVRDIVVRRDNAGWIIGLSIKHNHEAVKHSRLSKRQDFGKEWFDIPCSTDYWNAVVPVFDRLQCEKENGSNWSDIADKDKEIYVPLLQAFADEVRKACLAETSIPGKMIEYLVGTMDYYKIVSYDSKRMTMISSFNMHGTLNQPGQCHISAIEIPIVELPTELIDIRFKKNSLNTLEMYLNNGWQLSFRIHNASTKVETSLKFDIQFIGMPPSVLNIECKWQRQ